MSVAKLISRLPWQRFRGLLSLTLAQMVTLGCGLLATVLWTRTMPQETFGEFRIVLAVHSFAGSFCLLGLAQTAIMAASGDKDGNFAPMYRARLLANFGGSAIICGYLAYYTLIGGGSTDLALSLALSAFLFPIFNTSDLWTSWLNGKKHFDQLAVGRAVLGMIPLASVATVAMLRVEALWAMVGLLLFTTSLVNAWVYQAERARLSNAISDRSIVEFGHHTSFATLLSSLNVLDVFILDYYYSPVEVAVYAIALQFPLLANSGVSIVAQLVSPRIYASQTVRESWQKARRPILLTGALFAALGVGGFFVLDYVLEFLFSAKYAAAAPYAKWLWLTICVLSPLSLLGLILNNTRRPVFAYSSIVGYSVVLALLYLLLGGSGVSGLIAARIIATLALGLFYAVSFLAYLKSPFLDDARA